MGHRPEHAGRAPSPRLDLRSRRSASSRGQPVSSRAKPVPTQPRRRSEFRSPASSHPRTETKRSLQDLAAGQGHSSRHRLGRVQGKLRATNVPEGLDKTSSRFRRYYPRDDRHAARRGRRASMNYQRQGTANQDSPQHHSATPLTSYCYRSCIARSTRSRFRILFSRSSAML